MKLYLRFLVIHVFVQSDDYDNSEQSGPPVNEEHDDNTHHGPYQGHPHVIVLKRGSPSGRLAKWCCKHCIVNECIGHEEEVWNDWRNDIQFSNGNEGSSDEKSQDVSTTRLVTRPHLSRKWGQIFWSGRKIEDLGLRLNNPSRSLTLVRCTFCESSTRGVIKFWSRRFLVTD